VQLRIHDESASFLAGCGGFLRAAEAENSMIATPVARMLAAPDPDDAGAYLACAVDRGAVVAVALHTPHGGVLVSAGPTVALELFAADMSERGLRPKSVVGPVESREAFARAWRAHTGFAEALRFRLRHFILTGAPAATQARGMMRRPEAGEYELLADWQAAFLIEAGLSDDPVRVRAKLARRIERGLLRVWDDGGLASCAGFTLANADGAR
jgi:hypothetical protein